MNTRQIKAVVAAFELPDGGAVTVQRLMDELTPREREVAELVAQGWERVDICRKLGLSLSTMNNHLTEVCKKLGTRPCGVGRYVFLERLLTQWRK